MASNWKSLIMKDGEKQWNAKPDNTEAQAKRRREGMLKQLEVVIAAANDNADKGPRGWYKTKGDLARATLRSGTKPVLIEGQEAVFVPRERLADFYKGVKADVEAKKLDAAIAEAWSEGGPKKAATGRKRVVSEEAKQKMRDAWKRRKAEQAKKR